MPKIAGGLRKKHRTHQGHEAENETDTKTTASSPSCFVIKRGRVSASFKQLVMDWRKLMAPNCALKLKESSKNSLKDFVNVSGVLGVTHLIMFSQTNAGAYMKFTKLPQGPTLTFKINEYTLMGDVQRQQIRPRGLSYSNLGSPVLIMNAFRSVSQEEDEKFKTSMLSNFIGNMFPTIDLRDSSLLSLQRYRRAILFHRDKTNDTIFVRYYSIACRPAGLSKAVRNIVCNVRRPGKLLDCGSYSDISELILKDHDTTSTKKRQYPSEESDSDSSQDCPLSVSQNPTGGDQMVSQVVRLYELGPRLSLSLLKIEEGVLAGKVLYHAFRKKP